MSEYEKRLVKKLRAYYCIPECVEPSGDKLLAITSNSFGRLACVVQLLQEDIIRPVVWFIRYYNRRLKGE